MLLLTQDAVMSCLHVTGLIQQKTSQDFVTIAGRIVLIEPDPVGRRIVGCPNINIGIKPCLHTVDVKKGYSELLRVGGRRVCLDALTGLTDGTPPGLVRYEVRTAGQAFVSEAQ